MNSYLACWSVQAMAGKTPDMWTHLYCCEHTTQEVKAVALQECPKLVINCRAVSASPVPSPLSSAGSGPSPLSSALNEHIPVPMQQKQELALLACIAANWPFESFEDPQVQEFLHALDPNFIIPAQQMLSGELLNHEYTQTHMTIATHQHGQYVMAQSDGWKDISKNHLIGF